MSFVVKGAPRPFSIAHVSPHDLDRPAHQHIAVPGISRYAMANDDPYEDPIRDLALALDAPSRGEVGPVVSALTHDSLAGLDGAIRLGVIAAVVPLAGLLRKGP